jgi:hypothetical protein
VRGRVRARLDSFSSDIFSDLPYGERARERERKKEQEKDSREIGRERERPAARVAAEEPSVCACLLIFEKKRYNEGKERRQLPKPLTLKHDIPRTSYAWHTPN